MNLFAFDFETRAHSPGCKAPPPACMTWQATGDVGPSILHARDARPRFEAAILDPNVLITGHFVAFDMSVAGAAWPDLLPAIFEAYERDRVTCTMLREKLFDIATGAYRGFADERGVWRRHDYNLDAVARRRAGIALKKDGWRRRYGEVIELPLADWPRYALAQKQIAAERVDAGVKDADLEAIANGDPNEIITYPLEDARATFAVHVSQDDVQRRCNADPFADQFRQARASFWMTLMSAWGLRTRAEGVNALRIQTEGAIAELESSLIAAGLVREDGSRNVKAATQRMLDACGWRALPKVDPTNKKEKPKYEKTRDDARTLRRTKEGGISLDRDACKESEDDVLIDYGERAQLMAVLDKDVPMLAAATFYPVHTKIDLANSGRPTFSNPNTANLRRLPGIREAFVPREGNVFFQADYPSLELHTLAQACMDLFGHSELAKMLNAGIDPHLAFAARLLKLPYDEAKRNKKRKDVDDSRQVGKVFNFGKPGGLGSKPRKDGSDPTLIRFARKTYGVVMTVEQAIEYDREWRATFPEMQELFDYVGRLCDNPRREGTIVQLRSKRIRGKTSFTAGCNTFFQGLGADATKHAGWHIAKACYIDRKSPMFGSRLVNYVYDEFIGETRDDDRAHDVAHELGRLMMVHANEWLPDCPFTEIEPLLMRVWSKDAETYTHPVTGRLVPWDPSLAAVIGLGKAIAANPSLGVAA